jgi:hypothetical protein
VKGAFIPIGGLTSRFAVQGPLGKTGHGSGVRPMFTKQVSRPMNSVDRPSWPLGGAGRANSKKDLVTRPIRGFCALQVYVEGQSAVTASGETVGRRDLVAQMSRWSRTSSRRALPGARGWSKWTIYVVGNDLLDPALPSSGGCGDVGPILSGSNTSTKSHAALRGVQPPDTGRPGPQSRGRRAGRNPLPSSPVP